MKDKYSSSVCRSAVGRWTRYTPATGRPRAQDRSSLLRFRSHQCGTHNGQRAMATSIATNGRTAYPGIRLSSAQEKLECPDEDPRDEQHPEAHHETFPAFLHFHCA